MSDPGGAGVVEHARDAASRGDWREAFDLLAAADADRLIGPADLPLLGEVAYGAGQLDVAIGTWERIHGACLEAGDPVGAAGAAVRVAMHLLLDTSLMAPVRGWLARADRLLEGHAETPVHAWIAALRTYERMLAGDLDGARPWARRAVDVGSRLEPAACAIARVAEARLLILDGEVEHGLALLDEAGVSAVSGNIDALSTGVVYCELVCALQGLAQYDLAEEWTEAMERWARTDALGSLHGRCRVHRAEILRLRGSWAEAEREALAACGELRPYLRRELGWPLSELGRIRLRRGDVDGAEDALLAARRAGWEPQPDLALVCLARGDLAAAVASIRAALERPVSVPSKERPPNSGLQRAPLLEAQVEIEIAAGDIDRARSAADELEVVATRFGSKALRAGAALARGRVELAGGDAEGAEHSFSEALRLWSEVGAPYESALSRRGLGEAHRARGREHQAALELDTAREVLAGLSAAAEENRSAGAGGDDEPEARRRSVGEVFRREGDYWTVVFAGRTVRVHDRKGMRYIWRLLADPGRELHVLDLVASEAAGEAPIGRERAAGGTRLGLGDAGAMLDPRAKDAYRRRLAEIDEDLGQAQAVGDLERAAQAEAERDLLVRELSRAVGLGGRDRRAGSASERARSGVTRALRQAMVRIGEHHPELAEHLDRSIHTGTYCSYLPDSRLPARWQL